MARRTLPCAEMALAKAIFWGVLSLLNRAHPDVVSTFQPKSRERDLCHTTPRVYTQYDPGLIQASECPILCGERGGCPPAWATSSLTRMGINYSQRNRMGLRRHGTEKPLQALIPILIQILSSLGFTIVAVRRGSTRRNLVLPFGNRRPPISIIWSLPAFAAAVAGKFE